MTTITTIQCFDEATGKKWVILISHINNNCNIRELLGRVKRKKLAMKEQKETPKKQEESDVTSISESEKLWQEVLFLPQ